MSKAEKFYFQVNNKFETYTVAGPKEKIVFTPEALWLFMEAYADHVILTEGRM